MQHCNGICFRLYKCFGKKNKIRNKEWGLILAKDAEVVEAYEQIIFDKTICTETEFKGHTDAYRTGLKDGKRFSISDKITESNAPLMELTS